MSPAHERPRVTVITGASQRQIGPFCVPKLTGAKIPRARIAAVLRA